jgi:hypothetical protein
MSATSQIHSVGRAPTSTRNDTPPSTGPGRAENPPTPTAERRLDAETIRGALSVLPTAVEDGQE